MAEARLGKKNSSTKSFAQPSPQSCPKAKSMWNARLDFENAL